MTDNEKMREEFEEWARMQGLDITDRSGLFYMNLHTFIAWNAWQAAKSVPDAELERLRKDAALGQHIRAEYNSMKTSTSERFLEALGVELDEYAGWEGVTLETLLGIDAAIVRAAAAIGEGMK